MAVETLKRSIFQRIAGISATARPFERESWSYADGVISIDLERTRELTCRGGAVRLEGKGLPDRILVINGDDGNFHAYSNRCRHMGRRLDPVPGTETIQCCSVSKATYDYNGQIIYGPARGPLKEYPIRADDGRLYIDASQS